MLFYSKYGNLDKAFHGVFARILRLTTGLTWIFHWVSQLVLGLSSLLWVRKTLFGNVRNDRHHYTKWDLY